MNRLVVAAAMVLCTRLLPLHAAQNPATQQEASPAGHVPYDLSGLELEAVPHVELENALKTKDYKKAETILVEEAERDPTSFRSAKLLEFAGGIFFVDGQYLNSAIAWKKAEAIAPLDERSRFTLAMAYIKLDRQQWAQPELEKLAAAQPRNPLYLYWLSRLDYDGQKYTEAVGRLQKVVELDPKMVRAYDLLGLCYDYLGRLDEAIKNFNRAVELNRWQATPSAWPHLDMAISQIELNQLADAEKNLREAISYDSHLPPAQFQLGRVLEKQGRNQEAIQALNQAATLDPAYPEPHYLLGRIYQRLGQGQLAKTEIERFQQLNKARPTAGPKSSSRPN